ncbi:hypothetical protein, partial [Streptomyces sp. NPDC050848]|uniref:hypothetical protein n=1 Tax=Streptomyces sp. NPDC050848 TaxID=3155791 RepID=UPI0033D1B79C
MERGIGAADAAGAGEAASTTFAGDAAAGAPPSRLRSAHQRQQCREVRPLPARADPSRVQL